MAVPVETLVLATAMLLALVLYFVFGGADFGGGVWDLLASGPRRDAQRALIGHAIGPVWEANHVWLIFAVVMLFGGFPRVFAAIGVALHVPLTLFLVGVVLRGSAFAFRSAEYKNDLQQERWGRVFGWASLPSPVLLGMCVGAIASGEIRIEGEIVTSGFFAPWLRPFPILVGLFALAQCAFLAATFLTYEAEELALREDFRKRALASGVWVGVVAFATFFASAPGAPRIWQGLTSHPWTWPFHAATAICAIGALVALWVRRDRLARVLAGGQVALVLFGWALSQYPWLVVPDLTLMNAASRPETQRALLIALAAGTPILVPSLWLLFRIFKSGRGSIRGGQEG